MKYTLSNVSEVSGKSIDELKTIAEQKGIKLPADSEAEISLDIIKQLDYSLAYKMRYAKSGNQAKRGEEPRDTSKVEQSHSDKVKTSFDSLQSLSPELSRAVDTDMHSNDSVEYIQSIITELTMLLEHPDLLGINDIERIRSKWNSCDPHKRLKEVKTYSRLFDKLIYSITLSDEERVNLYATDLAERVRICEELEGLKKLENTETPIGHMISNLNVKWLSAGPVSEKDWAVIEKRYKAAKESLKKEKKGPNKTETIVLGYVKWYDSNKGFGYVVTNNKNIAEQAPYKLIDIRINKSDIKDTSRLLDKSFVVFSVSRDRSRGNALCAKNIRKVTSSENDIDIVLGYRGKYSKIEGTDSKSYERYDIDIIPYLYGQLWKNEEASNTFFAHISNTILNLSEEKRKEYIDELLSNSATNNLIENSIEKIITSITDEEAIELIKSRTIEASISNLRYISIKRYIQNGIDISASYPRLMSALSAKSSINLQEKTFLDALGDDMLTAMVQSIDISAISDSLLNYLYNHRKEVFLNVFRDSDTKTDVCSILLFSIDNDFNHLLDISDWPATLEWLNNQPNTLITQVVKGFIENVDVDNDETFPLLIPDLFHKAIYNLGEDEKIQLLQQIPLQMAISVVSKYYKGTKVYNAIIEEYWTSIKANIPYVVFDMEYNGDSIEEFSFRQENNTRTYQGEEQIKSLLRALKRNDIVVGYQVKGHKLSLLENRGLDSNAFVWDTLEIELLLDPCRYAYSLRTSSESKYNTELVDRLFWNQLYRLSKDQSLCETIKDHLPECINDIFAQLQDPNLESLFSSDANSIDSFFQELEAISPKLEYRLKVISHMDLTEKTLFIAPKALWGKIAQNLLLNFADNDDEINYKAISKQKLLTKPLENSFLQTILIRFMEMSKTPLVSNLAQFLRLNYFSDDLLKQYTADFDENYGICCDINSLGLYNDRRDFNRIFFVGCEMDSRLDQFELPITMTTADFLRKGCWIPMRLAGANYMIVNDNEIQALELSGLPEDTANVWVERQLSGEFKFWFNVNYEQRISTLKQNNQSAQIEYLRWENTSEKGRITLVSSVKKGTYNCGQNRVGSISRFRPMYWVTQLNMVKAIQNEEKGCPMIYVLDSPNEITAVEGHARSLGFYIPDQERLSDKVEEICNNNHSLLVISREDFYEVVSLRDYTRFVYIWDNLSVDKTRMMWTGQMPFGDEANAETEHNNQLISTSEVTPKSCILAAWPTIEYHNSYIRANNPLSKLYVLEPHFDDFGDLAEAWMADQFTPQLWKSDKEYNADLTVASQFHKDIHEAVKENEENSEDVDVAMEVIRKIFLPAYEWRESQLDVLPAVLSRKKDYLISIPTGGGKSILFQGPALYHSAFTNKLSIVITPLKALMEDQVNKLHDPSLGFYTNVDYLNSDKTLGEVQQIYRKIKGGELALLYVTPERFRARSFLQALEARMKKDNGLEYFIFDEAHCVSQWGQEFRPDYLNVMDWLKKFKETYPQMCVAMYSATVTKQIQDAIVKYLPNIERRGQKEEDYNPVRSHIGMSFIEVGNNDADRIKAIAKYIVEKNIDYTKSRMLVFCRTRKQCEMCAETLYDTLVEQHAISDDEGMSPIGYFHAGMDAEDREDAYLHFKNGDISILCATKAFGMGMDIPNVHYIVHFSPPSVLEDYLQEVGRAGRSKEDYESAGFVGNKLLPTVCLVSKEDFRKAKELLIKGMLSWTNLNDIRKKVLEYITQIQSVEKTKTKPVVLPLDLWRKDNMDDSFTSYRLGLYWLECLERLKLGFTCPSHINIRLKPKYDNTFSRVDSKVKDYSKVYDYILKNYAQAENDVCQIPISELTGGLRIGMNRLLDNLVRCVAAGWMGIEQDMRCEITLTRTSEVLYRIRHNTNVTLDIIFNAISSILSNAGTHNEFVVDSNYREEVLKSVINYADLKTHSYTKKDKKGKEVVKEYMIWVDEEASKSKNVGLGLAKSYKRDIYRKRAKHIFSIMQLLPDVNVKSELDTHTNQIQQLVSVKNDKWRTYLGELKKDCIELLKYVVNKNNKLGDKGDRINWAACLIDLKLVDKGFQHLNNLLYILKVLGYLNSGNMLPMGIEVYSTETSDKSVNNRFKSDSIDAKVKSEFELMNKMRKIRLAAMTAFAGRGKASINQFIAEYFKCVSFDDFFALVSAYYDENNKADREFIAATRDEAIIKEEEQLGEEQKPIYHAPLDEDINVIAGPGSGKTHILTLRCARMIYRENVSPTDILVLAYNRAVVVELRNRLDRLFGRLGLSRSASKVHVHTFSALSKVICGHSLDDVPLEDWEDTLLDTLKENPMVVKKILPNIKYIMIDEFQDITQTRLDSIFTLRSIYPDVKIFTIGDKNQSIYGFDKKIPGIPESTSPDYYYSQLVKGIKPHEYTMKTNYRSYQKILDAASVYLKNPDEAPVSSKSIMLHEPNNYVKIVQWQKGMKYWTEELPELIREAQGSLKNVERHNRIEDIAVFFRSNDEVYRGYERVSKMNLQNIRLRIQGASACELYRVREIYEVLNYLYSKSEDEIVISGSQTQNEMRQFIEGLMSQYPNWDRFHLDFAYTLVLDYLEFVASEEATYTFGQMADAIKESTMADDGQIFKIYDRYQEERIDRTRQVNVILTTMHKVKGLEFDTVIVTPSFASLPFDGRDNPDIDFDSPLTAEEREELQEERRLQYVAYTRARKRLSVYRFNRELHLDKMQKIRRQDARLGWNDKAGIDKYFLSFLATDWYFKNNAYVEKYLGKNEPLTIEPHSSGDKYQIKHNGTVIGQLSRNSEILRKAQNNRESGMKLPNLSGIFVSEVYVWTWEDTLKYDELHDTNFQKFWGEPARRKGYIYIVDFAGYAK